MDVHDGLEMVVCPAMLAGAVVPSWIRPKKLVFARSASTLLRFVPSTPMTRTFGEVSASSSISGGATALLRSAARSDSSRAPASVANAIGSTAGEGASGAGCGAGCSIATSATSDTGMFGASVAFDDVATTSPTASSVPRSSSDSVSSPTPAAPSSAASTSPARSSARSSERSAPGSESSSAPEPSSASKSPSDPSSSSEVADSSCVVASSGRSDDAAPPESPA